jgi:hypothetical protein
MKSLVLRLLVLLVLTLAGCSSPAPLSPREAFLSQVPDRKNYYRLYEVSPESLLWLEDRRLSLTTAITRAIRDTTKNCPDCPDLDKHLAAIDDIAGRLREEQVQGIQQLKEAYDSKTDTILFFHYWIADDEEKVDEQEYGYLVTQGGKVKKRVVLVGGSED